MTGKKLIAALGAFFVLAAAIAGCGSAVPGDSVASMAGNPITTKAFDHWMFVAAKSQAAQSPGQPIIVPTDPPDFPKCVADVRKQIPTLAKTPTKTIKADCARLFGSLSSQVLDFLIRAYWLQAEAAKLHVNVSDAQVKQAFNKAKTQQFSNATQFNVFLKQTGQTLDDILFRFRINQIYTKLLAKQNTKVTPAKIQAYYNSHRSQFGTPESRDLQIVLTKTAAEANAAKSALAHHQSWSAVAKKYSTDTASKNSGGLLKGVIKGQEDAALDKVAFAAPTGKLLGPIKGQFGYYLVEVTKIHAATTQSLAQATPLIKQTLQGLSQTQAQTAVDSKAKKDWISKTKCRSGYVMADCAGYKAPKSAAPTAPGNPSAPAPQSAPPSNTGAPGTTSTG